MSAFLVADETINRVVEWLFWEIEKSGYLQEQIQALGIDTTADQWSVQLGHVMFQLNSAGVIACYGEGETTRFLERTYRYAPAHGARIQVLKSLWLLYGCSRPDRHRLSRRRLFCTHQARFAVRTDCPPCSTPKLTGSVTSHLGRASVSARIPRSRSSGTHLALPVPAGMPHAYRQT